MFDSLSGAWFMKIVPKTFSIKRNLCPESRTPLTPLATDPNRAVKIQFRVLRGITKFSVFEKTNFAIHTLARSIHYFFIINLTLIERRQPGECLSIHKSSFHKFVGTTSGMKNKFPRKFLRALFIELAGMSRHFHWLHNSSRFHRHRLKTHKSSMLKSIA